MCQKEFQLWPRGFLGLGSEDFRTRNWRTRDYGLGFRVLGFRV